ncbi:hypothetical protein [Plantactinospora soyae]|uniref:Uncharacterized protein n=1 Tax=Plantactinospora soyae TaxID=1544732 RepID=A0A927M4N5_9ACTN|nr:hypothetical protein [Plantactinospora soyae]MBE1487957.1 hypothetical protein [Plantactinospora soyae]
MATPLPGVRLDVTGRTSAVEAVDSAASDRSIDWSADSPGIC